MRQEQKAAARIKLGTRRWRYAYQRARATRDIAGTSLLGVRPRRCWDFNLIAVGTSTSPSLLFKKRRGGAGRLGSDLLCSSGARTDIDERDATPRYLPPRKLCRAKPSGFGWLNQNIFLYEIDSKARTTFILLLEGVLVLVQGTPLVKSV
jgi:hypothetical protein